jgi:hypothetical protein
MDYRTGHQIISGTKYDLTWPGRLEESAAFNREVGFILPNSVVETAPGSEFILLTLRFTLLLVTILMELLTTTVL